VGVQVLDPQTKRKTLLTRYAGIGTMFANTLDANGAAKVYILGRRMDKLKEVASAAVCTSSSTTISSF
jgi:short-subunit dehydrogenase involved in D-alanine esterification of teichoic acids